MTTPALLIIEDDRPLRQTLSQVLTKRHYQVDEADSLAVALAKLEQRPFDLLLLDLQLADGNGRQLIEKYGERYHNRIIVITGTASIADAVMAMKNGAFEFITKPFDRDVLLGTIHKALEIQTSLQYYQELKQEFASAITFDKLIFRSRAMAVLVQTAKKLALSDRSILISGETGTGKEIIAQAIHHHSARSLHPFVAVNCASIPETLAESELFGFKKGAFTGASEDYPGKFLLADGGTILLDEIGQLPWSVQGKLLRILESGELSALKSKSPQRVDLRLLAATNADLEKMVQRQQFRQDLYYRIEQSRLHIPPLRERRGDILPLAEHFLQVTRLTQGGSSEGFDEKARRLLLAYNWPGNVRELKNVVGELAALNPGKIIQASHLPAKILGAKKRRLAPDRPADLAQMEREHIVTILEQAAGNRRKAAALLGISRSSLYRKLERYQIES